jgi:membrane-bound lytic murein transglycosylase D
MRRIYFLILFSVIMFPAISGTLLPHDSTNQKQKSSSKIFSNRFSPLSSGDTSQNPYLNTLLDTTLVLPRDFPMPVDENSHFENELYKRRLDSLQKQVPLTYNEYVQSYINLYVYKRRPLIERLLGEGQYYFPIFEKVLIEAGIPAELKYLPIIESALNPFAVSRVGATGPWQFMYGTGKDYGLQINSRLDERRDPYRSTQAAAHYFKDMYQRYGDWLLVIASYNCGKGNIDKAIRRAGGVKDFWQIQKYLPRETRTYVPAFIAATYMMSFAWQHGLHISNPAFSAHPDTLKVDQTVSLSSIAENLCVSELEIKRLNPQYKKGLVEGRSDSPLNIWVPGGNSGKIPSLLSLIKSNPDQFISVSPGFGQEENRRSLFSRFIHYRVRSRETLSSLADRYSCEVQDIKHWNHLRTNQILPGQKLKLKEWVKIGSSNYTRSEKHTLHYRVRKGDTLESIALRFNISINHLKGLNRLHSNLVRTGQNLKLKNSI